MLYYRSLQQKCVSLSREKAEYVALPESIKAVLWLLKTLKGPWKNPAIGMENARYVASIKLATVHFVEDLKEANISSFDTVAQEIILQVVKSCSRGKTRLTKLQTSAQTRSAVKRLGKQMIKCRSLMSRHCSEQRKQFWKVHGEDDSDY